VTADPRTAPLVAALPPDFGPFWDELPQPAPFVHETEFNRERFAAAILAALPDGWTLVPNDETKFHRDMSHSLATFADEQADTIATLRADVERERERVFVIAGQARENEAEREIDTLRAALDGLVEAADRLLRTVHGEYCGSDLGVCRPCADDRDTIAVAKEAIAAAGETTDV
jgi:hypothetical protein